MIKQSATSPHLLTHRGPARVFDSPEAYQEVADDPELDIDQNTVIVIRNAGPKGYPGMPEVSNVPLPAKLLKAGVKDMVRICDCRMSGTGLRDGGPARKPRGRRQRTRHREAWRAPPSGTPAATPGSTPRTWNRPTRAPTSVSCAEAVDTRSPRLPLSPPQVTAPLESRRASLVESAAARTRRRGGSRPRGRRRTRLAPGRTAGGTQSALLLSQAKGNNASCAIGPFIRLLDDGFDLDTVRGLDIDLRVDGTSPRLGALVNTVIPSEQATPWTFGVRALIRNPAQRGVR
ncbi:dihydroxy-acid dehydratase [Streptomyces sp. Inha503]|uniref:dihydroxy-acid dehydratase domain-containing protein n=1 Tax=Streptomyces sp. Inha503 TaxID=3383314 RepID=UPI0039A3AB42